MKLSKALGAAFLIIGLMLIGAGVAEGFVKVSVAPDTSCGSAFSGSDTATDNLTGSGEELCAQARTAHTPAAVALLVAGGVALIGGLCFVAIAAGETEPEPEATAASWTPTAAEPSGPFS